MSNRIELSRRAASTLHEQTEQQGGDPSRPYAFACSAASKMEIAVERVPGGDVRLRSGRAFYDPDAMLILHEQAEDAFTEAFLVAHEIGHVSSGGEAKPLCVVDVDLTRSEESSGVGVDRVVDYSHRERREIQMDLFAREFLLPRRKLRRLHVDGQLTASQIAAEFKAPFPTVAQQLLDALLIPDVDIEDKEPASKREPNERQREAINHRGVAFQLEAGPGTGKTQTLVHRVSALLDEGVDPHRLLILTFSNKAANELSERIALANPEGVTAMWIGTFHAFGLDLVRRFHDRLSLPKDPRLLDRSAAIALLEDIYPSFDLKHLRELVNPAKQLTKALDAISRAKDEVVHAEEYARLSLKMLDSATNADVVILAEKCVEVAQIYTKYEELKRAGGLIDFGDLVSLPVQLCVEHPDVAEHLCRLYEHILVDEYQDVNRASVRLLKALAGDGKNLWVVGDAKQSIYRFRGASSFNMTRFLNEDFPGAETGRLEVNYRSVPEITKTFAAFASAMSVSLNDDSRFIADRKASGLRPELRIVETADDEIAALADAITEMQLAGHAYRNQAILCTGQDRLARIGRALERMEIPVLHLGNLFERDEIRNLLSLLTLLVDSRGMGLLRAATISGYECSLSDVSAVLDYLRENECEPLDWLCHLDGIQCLSAAGSVSLAKIGSVLGGFQRSARPWTVLVTVLLDRSRVAAELFLDGTIKSQSNGIAIWQFMNFVRTLPPGRGLPITRLLDRIRELVLHSDERDLRNLPTAAEGINAVRLMTMHASKGLEFPVVHLPGLTSSSIPRSANASLARGVSPPDGMIDGANGPGIDAVREGLDEEQECLFFVALSRAKDRLFLYRPSRKSNGHSNPASRFIAKLGATIDARQVTTHRQVVPDPHEQPIPVSLEEPFAFSDYQLALYERCPRRFLYAHVLRSGGRRKESAFMKLHLAVEDVVNDLLQHLDGLPSHSEVEGVLQSALESYGFGDGTDDYDQVARDLISYFVQLNTGFTSALPEAIWLPIPGGQISVTPDQHLSDASGQVYFRRVKTGHKLSDEENSLEFAILQIAAESCDLRIKAQIVHLSDGKVSDVSLTSQRLKNKKAKLESVGDVIRAGEYPATPSVTCPRCPAYFVCGDLPDGTLRKKLSD